MKYDRSWIRTLVHDRYRAEIQRGPVHRLDFVELIVEDVRAVPVDVDSLVRDVALAAVDEMGREKSRATGNRIAERVRSERGEQLFFPIARMTEAQLRVAGARKLDHGAATNAEGEALIALANTVAVRCAQRGLDLATTTAGDVLTEGEIDSIRKDAKRAA